MPSIDKLLPRSLNQDDDERLVKRTEMTDAQNVRVSVDVQNDSMVLKNAWGNTLRSGTIENGTMPSGTNVTVGSVGDDSASQVYYFVYNSNANHSIFRYDQNGKKTYLVYQDSILQFSEDSHVQADIVKNTNGDILLYFNDGRSAPKKINVTLCEQSTSGVGGYPSTFSSGTDQERLQYITVCKAPPLAPPTMTFVNNPDFQGSDIYTKNFQFAYQYEYFDGEQSALSPYSRLSIAPNQLKDGFNTAAQENFYNQININVNNSNADVKKIKVYGRQGDKISPFFLIDTVDNANGTASRVIPFRNDTNYRGLNPETQDKLYDNVPQKADSQAVCGERLFYGGYTENYDNLTTMSVTAVANYTPKPDSYSLTVSGRTIPFLTNNEIAVLDIDTSSLPSSFDKASTLFLSFTWNDGAVVIRNSNDGSANKNYTFAGSSFLNSADLKSQSTGGSTVEKLKALAGIQVDAYGQAGINVNGALNAPPTLQFVSQKGTSDSEEKDISIRSIKGGLKLISSGIQVREMIDIPQGTTKLQALNLIANSVAKLRPISFEPQEGAAGFSNLWTGGETTFKTETANFKGQGSAWFREHSRSGTDLLTFFLELHSVRFYVNKLTFGIREAEIIDPQGLSSSFDIITFNKNGLNNAMRGGINSNGGVRTLDGDKISYEDQGTADRKPLIERIGAYVSQGGCVAIANNSIFGSRCFKSGATHQFGLVYFDDRGRASGVQPIEDETTVLHTNNRSTENDLHGYADITVRLKDAPNFPPSWASRYSLVYAGNGSNFNKIQYGIGGAYVATNDDGTQGSFGATKNIYLSFNTLQSKDNSYVNQQGAMINYGFAPGDMLRIVRYDDASEYTTATWRVSKMVTLLAEQASNPLLDRSSKAAVQNTTGDFIVIEDNGTQGWDYNSIARGTSNWDKDCIIEIYRPSKAFDNVFYYEIGENHAIENGQHVGERASTSFDVYFSGAQNPGVVVGYAAQRLYKGDKIQDSGGNQIIVGNTFYDIEDTVSGFPYKFYGNSLVSWTGTTHAITVTNPDCVLRVDQGDSYYRLRTLFVGAAAQKGDVWKNLASAFSQNSIVDFVEDPRVSDFFESEYTSLGRSFVYSPDAQTTKRYGSITYSDPYRYGNTKLGLSSFNLTKLNFKDMSYSYGSIRALVPYDEMMYLIHERRAGVVPVGRNILTSDAGDQLVSAPNVLGPSKYYVGDYGCNNNPESVATYRGFVFFVDAKAGKVVRINYQSGIDIISEQLMDYFFKSKMFSTSTTAANRRYIGGVDRENNEYIISSPALSTSTITVTDDLTGNTVTGNGRTNSLGTTIDAVPVYDNSLTFNWDSDPRDFDTSQDEAQVSGQSLIIVNQLTNQPIIAMSEDLSPSRGASLSTDVETPVTTSAFDAFTTSSFSQSTSALTLTASPDSSGTISGTSETLPAFTIAYDMRSTWWSTRYSYIAEEIISLSDRLYTFKNGLIYEHNPDAARNTFYGTAGDTIIEVISNFNPSMIKAYEAVSLEGNNGDWTAVLESVDQTSTIASSIWETKEGFYYAPIHRNSTNDVSYTATGNITSLTGTSELFSLGVVASVASDVITFKNAINNMSFPLGNTTALFKLNSVDNRLEPLNLYAASVSGEKALTCDSLVGGVVADDEIVLIANSAIEGDTLRNYYLKGTFSNPTTSEHELYAVNFIYSKSNLHNQQGQ